MATVKSVKMTSETRIGIWCFGAWCVTVAVVISVGLAHDIPLSSFLELGVTGRTSLWQSLVFAISMSAFGFYMALTTKPRRIPEDPARIAYNLKLFAKGGGWIFALGGILVALRVIGLLQNE